MALTDEEIRRADADMHERLRSGSSAASARFDIERSEIVVELRNGGEFRFSTQAAEGLSGAQAEALQDIEISPTGLGLHWPQLDADLYLPALMDGVTGSAGWGSTDSRRARAVSGRKR